MAYPAGVVTRQVQFVPAVAMEDGDPVTTRVTITASRSLIWDADNTPVIVDTDTFSVDPRTGSATIALPVTDQTGYIDTAGEEIESPTHTYDVLLQYIRNGTVIGSMRLTGLVLPEDDGSTIAVNDLRPAEVV